jgi:hypothetical protein
LIVFKASSYWSPFLAGFDCCLTRMYEKAVPGGFRRLAERRCFSLITQNSRVVAACEVLHEEIVAQLVCDVQITASVVHIPSGEEHSGRGTFCTASTAASRAALSGRVTAGASPLGTAPLPLSGEIC